MFYLSLVVPIFVAIAGVFVSELFFTEFDQSVIAGLLIGLYSVFLQLFFYIRHLYRESLDSFSERTEHFLNLLKIDNDFDKYPDLSIILDKIIVAFKEASSVHPLLMHFAHEDLKQGISELENTTRGKSIHLSGWKKEITRKMMLIKFVKGANKYIYAVTSYDDKYWEDFWLKDGKEYIKANIDAAEKGVIIKRIFIIPKDLLDRKASNETFNQLTNTIRQMLGKDNLSILCTPIEQLSPEIEEYKNTNFLVVDNIFTSFSENYSDEKTTKGYVSMRMDKETRKLKEAFDKIKYYSKPAEYFAFIKNSDK